jgi:hypothetical protein
MSNMSNTALILYRTEDGLTELQLKSIDGTVWLTQSEIAELFQTTPQNITLHIKAIYEEGELEQAATCKDYLQVQMEGSRQVKRQLMHYNLNMMLAVGYRIKSSRGTQFRIWATTTLREYLVKGFVMNDERLKNPNGTPYFDEFLERIREIRASEKLFYQKVRDVYTKSMDYDPKSDEAQRFFRTIQNKMLYAVTGMTAAELVKHRSDAALPNMGLTHWEGSQKGRKVRKSHVITAKNYLVEEEIANLNRIVTMFLDVAEDTAKNQQAMYMKDWEQRLDEFLQFNKRSVLNGAGQVSHDHAAQIAHERYATFDLHRREQESIQAEREAADDLKELEKEILGKMGG